MPLELKKQINDREYDKFECDDTQGTVVKVRPQGKGVPFFLINEEYDNIDITYDAIETDRVTGVIYKLGLATVAVLTLTYDVNGNVSNITKV